MCFGGGSEPERDTYVEKKQADLMRQLEADWAHRFKPVEEGIVNEMMNRDSVIRQNVAESGVAARKSYDATKDMAERNMASYGTQMDADQQAAMERSDAMASQSAELSARNMARDSTTSRMDQQQGGMVSLGRGVQQQGISGLNAAGQMEASRNVQNQQNWAQGEASKWETVGQVAAVGAMMMMSDRNTKTNVRRASRKESYDDVNAVDLKKWDYKPGMSAGRPEKGHIGGMAQDMPDSMTTKDKKQVDIGDSVMLAMGAIQHLSKKVKRLEKEQRHARQ